MNPAFPQPSISASHLLSGFAEALPAELPDVRRLCVDSRELSEGDVFVALRGYATDGRRYLREAESAGAAFALVDEALPETSFRAPSMPCIVIPELREKLGFIASRLYGEPSKRLHLAAVTGTNGKTTVSQLLAQMIRLAGYDCGVIGTLGVSLESQPTATEHTTPDPVALQEVLARWAGNAVPFACMEASSHALAQGRLNGVEVDTAIFTNLTRDHLDFHGSMQAYGEAKTRLFQLAGVRTAVVNADDDFADALCSKLSEHTGLIRFSAQRKDVELYASKLTASLDGLRLRIDCDWGRAELRCPLLGEFNASNLLAAFAAALKAGLPFETIASSVERLQPVVGRMQPLRRNGSPLVVVDYAHTPDALAKALQTLRPLCKGDLIVVFGCGGDRDRGKRRLMAEVAAQYADRAVITSDNPRSEDPLSILNEIAASMSGDYILQEDRGEAIGQALASARPGDCVLVAGKGHEDYQIVGGETRRFSDLECAQDALARYAA